MFFHRTFPPSLVTDLARGLEDGGADQLWIIEDCFFTSGVSLAAAALTVTDRLRVGLGILPAVARNPAITAMEIATLSGLAPGRILPGIGHGVQDWMAQMGARTPSPLTTLEEVLVAVRRLLAGERVTMHGRHVHLDDVQLDQPPPSPPPVLAGVRGPKSLAMAGRVAGGMVLAEPASSSYVRLALSHAGHPANFHVAVFAVLGVDADRRSAYEHMSLATGRGASRASRPCRRTGGPNSARSPRSTTPTFTSSPSKPPAPTASASSPPPTPPSSQPNSRPS
jgi:5,10-methylenetetrahydromethanopterin reductase